MIDLTAAAIARALGGHRQAAYWTAKCPAHDDHSPSLSISETPDATVLVKCHAGCAQCDVIDALRDRGLWPQREERRRRPKQGSATNSGSPRRAAKKAMPESDNAERIARAQRLLAETLDPRGTWVEEEYLASRNLRLPADPELLLRTLRFHPHCPFPDGNKGPALIAAFTPIEPDVPDDPFLDPPPCAIHRIRGRGHDNKAMLGPVKGCAIMVSPWWHVCEHLHICEGVETALALYAEGLGARTGSGVDDPDAWQPPNDNVHRPIWALGSAGALADFPVISRVRRLVIWADHDASGTGIEAARACAGRWSGSGRRAVIRYPENEGEDYAE